jgi:hypothetical protein
MPSFEPLNVLVMYASTSIGSETNLLLIKSRLPRGSSNTGMHEGPKAGNSAQGDAEGQHMCSS